MLLTLIEQMPCHPRKMHLRKDVSRDGSLDIVDLYRDFSKLAFYSSSGSADRQKGFNCVISCQVSAIRTVYRPFDVFKILEICFIMPQLKGNTKNCVRIPKINKQSTKVHWRFLFPKCPKSLNLSGRYLP